MPDPAEKQSCCACLHVEYAPINLKDGYMQERWRCTLCETEFVRFPQLRPLRQRVAEVEQERDSILGRIESVKADLGEAPCDCIEMKEQSWTYDCQCSNRDDMAYAAAWCREANVCEALRAHEPPVRGEEEEATVAKRRCWNCGACIDGAIPSDSMACNDCEEPHEPVGRGREE